MNVLVTGGSGTLGSEVCRQLVARGDTVVAIARDNSRLLSQCPTVDSKVLADVRNVYRLVDVCQSYQIDAVVHCAANKHVGACEEQPAEAVGANITGTANVLKAMQVCNIPRGVFVSSDKATDGTVYGATKFLGERLVSAAAHEEGRRLACVRPGNIIGSAGSVVDIWARAYRRGDPIRLDMHEGRTARRFVMRPSDAARLVIDGLDCNDLGVVIAHRMPIVDIKTLAAVIAPDAVMTEAVLPREWVHQTVISESESAYLSSSLSRMVIDRSQPSTGPRRAYSTHNGPVLTSEETRIWMAGSSYLPASDLENKVCS